MMQCVWPTRAGWVAGLVAWLSCTSAWAGEPIRVDVAVYGGTPAGIAAALAARRSGATALIVEPTRHVGGLSTSGINTAETEHMLKWTIGGIALEFYRRLGDHYQTGQPEFYFESSVAQAVYDAMLREAGVAVHYGAAVDRVEKTGARIDRISLTDKVFVEAKFFVDAGYEGDLLARAGVSWVAGREGKAEFGEEAAGVRFDLQPRAARTVDVAGQLLPGISARAADLRPGDPHPAVMNYNFRLCFTQDPDKRAPVPSPANSDPARWTVLRNWIAAQNADNKKLKLTDFLDLYKRRNGKFEVNNKQAAVISLGHFGGQFGYPEADYEKRAEILADHREYTLGLLHFLASDPVVPENVRTEMRQWGLHQDEFVDNGNWPYQVYVREGRRLRGVYVVTQKDVQEDRRKPDGIGLSSHFIDSHHVQRVAVSDEAFVNEGRIWRPGHAYQIPYRALLPKPDEATNLLAPGPASYTHVAFCTLRLESVWMIAGHAAGCAAALAVQDGATAQGVDVDRLRALLRSQGQVVDFLPGAKEKWDGPVSPPEF